MSGSFADDCICSGLVFFKATEVLFVSICFACKAVAKWLLLLLSWMYEHAGSFL